MYEDLRNECDKGGMSMLQSQLIKAFTHYRKVTVISKVFSIRAKRQTLETPDFEIYGSHVQCKITSNKSDVANDDARV